MTRGPPAVVLGIAPRRLIRRNKALAAFGEMMVGKLTALADLDRVHLIARLVALS